MWSKSIWEGKDVDECNLSRGFNTAGKGEAAQRERTLLKDPPPRAGRPPWCTFPLVAQLNCVLGQVGKVLSKRWICGKPVTHTTDAH